MATTNANPKSVTIRGRLSFPVFEHIMAVERNKTSKFPKATDKEVNTEFNLLIESDQFEKLRKHLLDVFIPYVEERMAKGEKTDVVEPAQLKKLKTMLAEGGDWLDNPPHLPMKEVSEKNLENMPEAVASVKVVGPKGADVNLQATVYSADQLKVPDADILSFPVVKPLNETVFDMYPGAVVGATLNLYAFFNSKAVNGISAGGNTAVYLGNFEGERFGGGAPAVDLDAIFMDD